MSEMRHKIKNAVASAHEHIIAAQAKARLILSEKKVDGSLKLLREKAYFFKKYPLRAILKKCTQKIKSGGRKSIRRGRKLFKKISSVWKILLICVPTFLFCYYGMGSLLAEDMDTETEYKLRKQRIPTLETPLGMSFLLKREVDHKMWTPNLPPVFPAYILDNMPNFQIGVVNAVKDITSVFRRFDQNTEAQKKEIKNAWRYLQYPPTVWLMTKKGKFNLAPSSNAQYRKAAAALQQFAGDGVYYPKKSDLEALLNKINKSLQKAASRNETHQIEHSTNRIDTKADDIFYQNRGYAYAMWQISRVIGADYREIILQNNAYTEWTYFVGSLQKAAKLKPLVVRNGSAESLMTPNHLIMQNYYLLRAMTAAEKICNKLLQEREKEDYANQN